jgi:hypothetical protein
VQHLHEVAYDYVSRGRVEVAANPAATKTQQPDQLSRIKTTQSVMPTERATFFNNIGHEPPRRSLAAVTGLHPILLQYFDGVRPGDFAVALFSFPR